MKKEVGSIFPLSDAALSKAESEKKAFSNDRVFYSLCREALYDLARSLDVDSRIVLIPAYTCQTVITPFEETGWQCFFYSINKDLRIVVQYLIKEVEIYHPSLIVVHPYYGMDLNQKEVEILNSLNNKGIAIVLDLTQCLFTKNSYSFASFIVASYRKWVPIPDGGYLLSTQSDLKNITQPETENTDFTEREIAAMYLRGKYFECEEQRMKDVSIKLGKIADRIVEKHLSPHRMSQVSYNILSEEDLEENQRRRIANYSYLFHRIHDGESITKVCKELDSVTTAPLYFTIYVKNRVCLQRQLASDAIYAPILWPVEDERVLINDEVKYIYDHLLAIPCDQRYNEKDMQRAVEIINCF